MHPRGLRCSSLEYCWYCWHRALPARRDSPVSVRRQTRTSGCRTLASGRQRRVGSDEAQAARNPRRIESARPHAVRRRHAPRPVRNHRPARRGRHGRGLPRARHPARSHGRHQGAHRRARGRFGIAAALRAGGARDCRAERSAHLHHPRRRPPRRARLPGARVSRRRDARGPAAPIAGRCRSTRRSRSRSRSATRSTARIAPASSIAI